MRYFFILLILFACQSSFKGNLPAISSEDLEELLSQEVIEIKNPFTSFKSTGYPLIGQTEDGLYLYVTTKALIFIETESYESFYEGYREHHNMKIQSPSKNSPRYLLKKVGEIPLEGQPEIKLIKNRLDRKSVV